LKTNRFFSALFFCGILFFASLAHAELLIEEVHVEGLTHTDPAVVLTELDLRVPQKISEAELQNAIQRVWNLNLFVTVKHRLERRKNQHVLVLEVEDRWTLIPIVKFGGGGGVSYYVLGAYNPNVLGKYLELGSQYENLGGRGSVVSWFRKPHLFGDRRARLGADVWVLSRNRQFYDENRNVIGGFNTMRRRLNVFYDYFVTDFFRPGIALDLQNDETSESGLSDETLEENEDRARDVDGEEDFHFLRLYATLGRQDIEEELVRGWSLSPSLQYQLNRAQDPLFIFRTDFLWAKVFQRRQNLAYRLSTGHNSRTTLSQDSYLGGLEHLRGFLDSQFAATNFAFQNLEYRFPLRYGTRLTLQQVIFHDVGHFVGNEGSHLVQSVGTGVRLIFPKIYRLNLRLDFGVSYGEFPGKNVSFGLQQLY
jgi:outer membrane protein assembly factor BamA